MNGNRPPLGRPQTTRNVTRTLDPLIESACMHMPDTVWLATVQADWWKARTGHGPGVQGVLGVGA